jgi:PD-(D/E)XK nuclease superfamily
VRPDNLLPDFPAVWDSTMRSAFVSCAQQWYLGQLLGLRKATGSIHLMFGGAIARGLEVTRIGYWQDGLDEIHAVAAGLEALIHHWGDYEPPPDLGTSRASVKTLDAALDALYSYFEQFPLGSDQITPVIIDGEPVVEKSFALPIPGTRHPVTGDPIIYAGRFDLLGKFNDAVFVVDEKTSGSLGQMWLSNWPLRSQITGYVWGAQTYGFPVAGAIIRGLGILKQSIQFQQVVLTRPQWLIDRWLTQLARDINRAAEMWRHAQFDSAPAYLAHMHFDRAYDSACSAYGGCSFVELCEAEDPVPWMDGYTVVHWDPLQRKEDVAV